MKHYTQMDWSMTGPSPGIYLKRQTVESRCYHCGKTTVFPVPETCIDWEKIANHYKAELLHLYTKFDRIGKDVEVLHGENPAAQYQSNEIQIMLADLRRTIEGFTE